MIDALGEILVKDEGNKCSQWLKFIFSSTECLCLSIWSKCSEFIETKTFIFKLIRDFSNYQNKVVGIELDGSEILWLLPGNKVVRATDLSCWNWKGHNVIWISRAQIICWLGSSYFRTFMTSHMILEGIQPLWANSWGKWIWPIIIKFRPNVPGIMANESVSGNFDLWNICLMTCTYATRLAYF